MKHKKLAIRLSRLFMPILCIGLFSFQTSNAPKDSVEGVWKLVSYKYGTEQYFSDVPDFMHYRKIVSGSNFQWVAYGKGDDVVGAGGGTFTLEGKEYTEHTKFFYPANEVAGTSTTFKSTVSKNVWMIEGSIKTIKLDPKTGEKKSIKETKMSEVWERIQ